MGFLKMSENHKDRCLIFTAFFVGFFSSFFDEKCGGKWIALWSLMPLFWMETRSRCSGFFVALLFYLSVSRGIVPGASIFFRDGSLVRAIVLWILSAVALAIPWGLLWRKTGCSLVSIVALCASVPPPLGLIGWGNPLTASGFFFPGSGWYGLMLMFTLYTMAAAYRSFRFFLIIFVPVLICCLNANTPLPSEVMRGVNTSFGRMASGSGDFEMQHERERQVFTLLRRMLRNGEYEGVKVVILPETLIGRIYPTTLRRWEKALEPIVNAGISFMIGAEVATDQGRKYDNVMFFFERGNVHRKTIQRFPVPFSMYRPFSGRGANASIGSLGKDSVLELNGKKIGFLICYEQFLCWPVLTLMLHNPDVLATPANLWWCKDTSLPTIRCGVIRLWAALFGVSVVDAVNR